MTRNPLHTNHDELAVSALNLMEKRSIMMLPVLDESGKAVGMLHMHDQFAQE
jgi:arabinose-5-phosphate isomerase